MYDMLPYYAGVYAYADKELHPSFPTSDKSFMTLWDQVDLSQWDGKAGVAPTAVKKEFTYADLATGDAEMRAKAFASSRCTTRTTPRRAGRASLPAAATISTP